MSLYVLGDVHGEFRVFDHVQATLAHDPDAIVIQVGDFGIWPGWETRYAWDALRVPVYFIDGNHEHFPSLPPAGVITRLFPNLYYAGRGSIITLDGRRIGFVGGGESIDYKWRAFKVSWFPEERVLPEDIAPLLDANLDLIVTHSPPETARAALFPPLRTWEWRLEDGWFDRSMTCLDALVKRHPNTPWYCGHMHKSERWNNVRMLDINELLEV